jgi:hypothetical protein
MSGAAICAAICQRTKSWAAKSWAAKSWATKSGAQDFLFVVIRCRLPMRVRHVKNELNSRESCNCVGVCGALRTI